MQAAAFPLGDRHGWWRRWDSNPHLSGFEPAPSADWGTSPRRGAPPRIRTGNLQFLKLAPLPIGPAERMVVSDGFEPSTFGPSDRRLCQLGHETVVKELVAPAVATLRPPGFQPGALHPELQSHWWVRRDSNPLRFWCAGVTVRRRSTVAAAHPRVKEHGGWWRCRSPSFMGHAGFRDQLPGRRPHHPLRIAFSDSKS